MSSVIEVNKLVNSYLDWLKKDMDVFEANDGWIGIISPFLDRHNDQISFFVKKSGKDYVFTDDGYTINDLEDYGVDLFKSPHRKRLLDYSVCSRGGFLDGYEIKMVASEADFHFKMHNFMQILLSVDDLFCLAQSNVRSLFWDDVRNYLQTIGGGAIEGSSFIGKSGYSHIIEYAYPRTANRPVTWVEPINSPNRPNIMNAIYKWTDTRPARTQIDGDDAKFIVLLNDVDNDVKAQDVNALSTYGITPQLWSGKENLASVLAA